MPLTISPDLHSLIPPLAAEELAQLEANLLAEGCRDPLTVWQGEEILLDGHNRYDICERHGLTYAIHELSLPDLAAAKAWMIANQLGRRNLTPEQMSYYRGEQYNLQKQQGKRTDLTSHHSDGRSQKTAQALAAQHKVGTATIERDGAYAEAVETLAAVLGSEARHAILAGDLHLARPDVRLLATLVQTSPETATIVRESLRMATQGTDPAPTLRAILQAARCAICHRPLSAPASVSRGIGPICAGHGTGGDRSTGGLSAGGSSAPPILTEVLDPEPPQTAPSWPQTVSSGDPEWYTPPEILTLVREVLGSIDVDPASCAEAQAHVQARTYYTLADDGLRQPWPGKVFLNPPYRHAEITPFISKQFEELDAQRTTEAILLVNAATETDWFQAAFARAGAVCFPDGRIHFLHASRNGHSPCQGQALLYYGPRPKRFWSVFAAVGVSTLVTTAPSSQLTLAEASPAPAPAAASTKRPVLKRKAAKKRAPVKRKAKT